MRQDWLACLPVEKGRLFDETVDELETLYWMLSVTLNEAFALRDKGSLSYAREQSRVSADLLDRFVAQLLVTLRALEEHGRHFGTLPNVVALNPSFFRGEATQQLAKRNSLLSKVLFSSRSKFFHKLHALAGAVETIRVEFRRVAEEISEGSSTRPRLHWGALDELHYDLNTCLREITVMLKSFLCALPDEEAQPFRQKLQAPAETPAQPGAGETIAVRHRRKMRFRRE